MDNPIFCRPANRFTRYRMRVKLRIRDLVRLLGHSSDTQYSRWASGTSTPSLKNALKLSFLLQCPLEVLYFDLYHEARQEVTNRKRRISDIHAPPEC